MVGPLPYLVMRMKDAALPQSLMDGEGVVHIVALPQSLLRDQEVVHIVALRQSLLIEQWVLLVLHVPS